jgi:hypothetical protein
MRKALKIFLGFIVAVTVLVLIGYILGRPQTEIKWGINYSTRRAVDLDMKPEDLFITIVNDLKPQSIRLPIYWEDIEAQQGQFDFRLYDRLLAEADRRNIEIIASLGHKQPRWPECHHPDWWNSLSGSQQDEALLTMLEKTVTHLKAHSSIKAWQVENEPFFPYGPDCPTVNRKLYKQELQIVRELDSRPLIGTDSGEKGSWLTTAWSGVDILGATMYREVYHDKKARYQTYPLPAWTYNVKAGWVKLLSGTNKTIGVELQAEPWFAGTGAQGTPLPEQLAHMNPEILRNNIAYARQVGFAENYLWGAEWWYWLARQGDPSLLTEAKILYQK